jgi:2-hydroxychromene-2-carboxylate isomerase
MIADWYFDFVSPFSYLQCERLQAHMDAVRPHPVLFAAILDANGQKGPAEIAAKRVFTYRFVVWQAKTLGIPLRFPHAHPFNPLPLLRLAIACDSRFDAITRIFRFVWRDGRLPDLPLEWSELSTALGVPDAAARIDDAQVKDELRRETGRAVARGVFGVPTLAIDNELFWGVDATDMALAYARAGARYDDPEYERVGALPAAALRREAEGRARSATKRS